MENEKLITAWEQRNFTQEKVAETLGASVASIICWEHGRLPSRFHQRRLCQFYELTEEQLGFRPVLPLAIAPKEQEESVSVAPILLELPVTRTHLVEHEEIIEKLKQYLLSGQNSAIIGMPGVRKNSLATTSTNSTAGPPF
jgi:transcriptional regulator with XRE-family HTH domain